MCQQVVPTKRVPSVRWKSTDKSTKTNFNTVVQQKRFVGGVRKEKENDNSGHPACFKQAKREQQHESEYGAVFHEKKHMQSATHLRRPLKAMNKYFQYNEQMRVIMKAISKAAATQQQQHSVGISLFQCQHLKTTASAFHLFFSGTLRAGSDWTRTRRIG